MLATAIIAKKRDGFELDTQEIKFMIEGMVGGSIPDYQIAAWAMAVLCRGMTSAETKTLTKCMLHSGLSMQRQSEKPRVDKHSTGGLGDKVSLILAPLLACCDVHVPMLSGRGLGITGGTLDKLESFEGFRCDLELDDIDRLLSEVGCVITGTTPEIAPADRQLYQLRDVTGTVPSIALITASILSKKLAENLDALVLDVKYGSGAFMKSIDEAKPLADSLVQTARAAGVPTTALLSNMNQALGNAVGNACEVNEAIEVLQGSGPGDVRQLTLQLAAQLLCSLDADRSQAAVTDELVNLLESGEPLERFIRMVEGQGGKFVERIPLASSFEIGARSAGYIASIDGQHIGESIIKLKGGRRQLGDPLDHQVGFQFHVGVGDAVLVGQPWLTVYARREADVAAIEETLQSAMCVTEQPVEKPDLFTPHSVSAT